MSLSSAQNASQTVSSAKARAVEIIETVRGCSYSCDPEMRRLPLKLVPELRGILDWHQLTTEEAGSTDLEIADILQGVPGRRTAVESYGFGSPPEFDLLEATAPKAKVTETSVIRALTFRTAVGGSSKDSQTRRAIAEILNGDDDPNADEHILGMLFSG